MADIYDIKKRADELSAKWKTESIPPEEVGDLIRDLADYANQTEINGSSLGIRKTYATVSAMEADSNPVDDKDGTPLRRGMLVNIYNQDDASAPDNGKVFSWQNPGWQLRTKLDAGYATTEQVDAIKTEQDEKFSELFYTQTTQGEEIEKINAEAVFSDANTEELPQPEQTSSDYATSALQDWEGHNIHEHYATREQLADIKPVVINGNVTNNADNEDLEAFVDPETSNGVMRLKDRLYAPGTFSGKGYKILRRNIVTEKRSSSNILTQDMINESNTVYEIRYDFDLGGAEIIVPEGCTLKFSGGSLRNGTVNGEDCLIKADAYKIFYDIKGGIKTSMNVYSAWFGNKTSHVNECCLFFENSNVIISSILEFDETINVNKPNISIEWHGECTLREDATFMIYQPGNGKMNCLGAAVYVQETQTKNVIVLCGQLSNSPHTGDHNVIDLPDVRYILDQNTPPLPNCVGLFIAMDKSFSSGYLYNKIINFNARSIDTAVAIGFQTINTNLANNIYNIVSWWCNKSLRYIKNETYTAFMDNGSTYNLMVEPNRQFEKIILIDDYIKNYTSIGECEYNLWIYDTQIIPADNKNKLIDISAKSKYNDMLYLGNTIGDLFNQDIGQSRLLLSSKGPMLPSANEIQTVSSYQLMRNYVLKGIEKEDDRKVAIQKFIFNILALKTGQNISFVIPFSTQTEDVSTEYDRIYKEEIVNTLSKLFSDDSGEFIGDKKMSGILRVWFIAQDSARSYDRAIFSFETIFSKVQFQVGMKLKPTTLSNYEKIDIRQISNFTFSSNITEDTYNQFCKYKGRFNFQDGIPSWYNGTEYIDANGISINKKKTGIFAQKPTGVPVGFPFFCTDKQTIEGQSDGIMLYHKGGDVWVDGLGRVIS